MGGAQSAERSMPAAQPGCFFNHVPQPNAPWYASFPVKYFFSIRDYDCDCRMIGQCPAGPPPHPPVQEFLRSAGLENADQLPREPEKVYKSDWSLGRYDPPTKRDLAMGGGGQIDRPGSEEFLMAAQDAFYNLPGWKQEHMLKRWFSADKSERGDPTLAPGEALMHGIPFDAYSRLPRPHSGANPEYVVVNMTKPANALNLTKEEEKRVKINIPSSIDPTTEGLPSPEPEKRQLLVPIASYNVSKGKLGQSAKLVPSFQQPKANYTKLSRRARKFIDFSKEPALVLSSFLANPSWIPNIPNCEGTVLINRCTTIAMDKAKAELAASAVLKTSHKDPMHVEMQARFVTLLREQWQFRVPTNLPPGQELVNFRGNSVNATDEICEAVIEQATSTIKNRRGEEVYMNDLVDITDALIVAVADSDNLHFPLQPRVREKIAPLVIGKFELDEEKLQEYFGEKWPLFAAALGFFTMSINAGPELVTL